MNLLIDIGNSCIKWAMHDSENLVNSTAEFYEPASLQSILDLNWNKFSTPDRLLVSNVAGQGVADTLIQWTSTHWKLEPEFMLVSSQACGVSNGYKDINQLGIDRWLALIAARKKFESATCIVDCGTAITIDGLSDKGQHLGGLILPGVSMMQQILAQQAHMLPEPQNIYGKPEFADNTQQGVVSGCMMAIVTLIDRMVSDMSGEYGDTLKCIITGGGAHKVIDLLASKFELDPDLVLYGLAFMTEEGT